MEGRQERREKDRDCNNIQDIDGIEWGHDYLYYVKGKRGGNKLVKQNKTKTK